MKKISFICVFCIAIMTLSVSVAVAEEQGLPKILMLTQPSCPACIAVKSVLNEVQNYYFVEIEEFNVREDMSVARKYGATRTPFLIFFDEEREEIGRLEGRVSKEEILLVFNEAGIELEKK